MNGDLISRSALMEAFENNIDTDVCQEDADYQYLWGFSCDTVESAIKAAPAVDAVEVCRCKDCKHSRERNEYEKNYLVEGVLICTSPDATDDCWNAVWGDHFCSYGERRADE